MREQVYKAKNVNFGRMATFNTNTKEFSKS